MRRSIGLAVLAMVGCGDSSSAPDAPVHADASADAVAVDTWTGTVADLQTSSPVVGGSVCILADGTIPCATTDGSGAWTLAIPRPAALEELAMIVTADGYLGGVFLDVETPDMSEYATGIFIQTDALAASELGSDAGFTYPGVTNGFIEVDVFGTISGQAPPGATVSISPSSGTGPVYTGSDGTPDPTLTATTTSRAVLFGNVAPGPVEITVTAPGATCNAGTVTTRIAGDWPPTSGGTLDAIVGAGAETTGMSVFCE